MYYNGGESCLYVNKTKTKANLKQMNHIKISKDFIKDEQSKISLNGTVYDFSVGQSSTKKEDILIFTNG